MEKQFVTTSVSPTVILEIDGDLRLKGQDELEVVAKSDAPENLTLEAQDDQVTIHCSSNCNVRVPRQADIQVKAVHGNAVIKAVDGVLTIDTVDGNLELRNVDETKISKVNGDLSAKNVNGDLTINSVAGNTAVRDVQGNFTVTDSVIGNLSLNDISGGASASANGNITLRLDPSPGDSYDFKALGNIFCRFSEDASVEINIPKASQVMPNLPGIHASAPVQAPYALTLGEGDAHITLTANGNIVLDTHAPDWGMDDFDVDVGGEVNGMADAISEQITQQVDSQVRMIEEQLNAQLSSLSMRLGAAKLSEDQARRIEERARETSDRAAARAQERIRRAQERLEQKLAAAQRKIELKAHAHEHVAERASRHGRRSWGFGIPTPPTPPMAPTPPGEPVSEEERLMILRMLEEKKISMEQAEELLSALEGKE
jgi:SHOCT-like domain